MADIQFDQLYQIVINFCLPVPSDIINRPDKVEKKQIITLTKYDLMSFEGLDQVISVSIL